MALCANAGTALVAGRTPASRNIVSVRYPTMVHLNFQRPPLFSISGLSRTTSRFHSRMRASADEEGSAAAKDAEDDAEEDEVADVATEEGSEEEEEATTAGYEDEDDEENPMSPEEIKAAYEALYGSTTAIRERTRKAAENPTQDEDQGQGRGRGRRGEETTGARVGGRPGSKDGLEETVVQVRRVTKVVKGGKQLSFRVVSVVGDKKGNVGVGVGKAKQVIAAVQKSVKDARRHMVTVPMTKYKTFPHRADGHYGAADVMLRPASPGTGVLAGGSVKIVLEMAGIQNALGKQMGGSKNCLNNARATLHAFSQMRHFHEVADLRGIPIEELFK